MVKLRVVQDHCEYLKGSLVLMGLEDAKDALKEGWGRLVFEYDTAVQEVRETR